MTDDDRVRCVECRNYTGTTCRRWRAADLLTAIVGPALAEMPQRCPAYVGVNVEFSGGPLGISKTKGGRGPSAGTQG